MPDSEAIQGTWRPLKAELGGEAAPELVLRRQVFALCDGRYTLHFDRKVVEAGDYEFTPGGELKALVFRSTQGIHAGRTLPCIYQLAGDRLRVCWGLDGTRPDAFTARSPERYLVIYKRQAS